MKVQVWAQTSKVGSMCEDEIEIPDEELEGLEPEAREALIEDWARDSAFNNIDWGYREIEETP